MLFEIWAQNDKPPICGLSYNLRHLDHSWARKCWLVISWCLLMARHTTLWMHLIGLIPVLLYPPFRQFRAISTGPIICSVMPIASIPRTHMTTFLSCTGFLHLMRCPNFLAGKDGSCKWSSNEPESFTCCTHTSRVSHISKESSAGVPTTWLKSHTSYGFLSNQIAVYNTLHLRYRSRRRWSDGIWRPKHDFFKFVPIPPLHLKRDLHLLCLPRISPHQQWMSYTMHGDECASITPGISVIAIF